MSLENVAKKVSKETGKGRDMSIQMARKLAEIHDLLKPVVSAWLCDEQIGFSFDGVTLDYIMAKENITYIQAILTMDILLKHPDFVADYIALRADADFLGD